MEDEKPEPRRPIFPEDIDRARSDPNTAKLPYKTNRPKRRRKGYLNDGQWAPGYGPDAKKKKE